MIVGADASRDASHGHLGVAGSCELVPGGVKNGLL